MCVGPYAATVPGGSDDPSSDPGARNSGEAGHGSVPGLSQGGMPQQMAGMGGYHLPSLLGHTHGVNIHTSSSFFNKKFL